MSYDDRTVTQRELREELGRQPHRESPLTFTSYSTANYMVISVVDAILRARGNPGPEPGPAAPEAITEEELAATLGDLGYPGRHGAPELARRFFNHALGRREPEFKANDMAQSSGGQVFVMQADGTWRNARTGLIASRPPRPLTKIGVAV